MTKMLKFRLTLLKYYYIIIGNGSNPDNFRSIRMEDILMSVYKIRYGTPEEFVPSKFAPAPKCEVIEAIPEGAENISFVRSKRGIEIYVPMSGDAGVYGFGLQLRGFQQRGRKKMIRPNADPLSDSGDSHAPVPFFVTTDGFGIYVDTARYASFYMSRELRPESADDIDLDNDTAPDDANKDQNSVFAALYEARRGGKNSITTIEIPYAEGVDLYYITGCDIKSIVMQYNMLSGGGCMPPMWGLGCYYRCATHFTSEQVEKMAADFRALDIPCDVIGIEPGWQTKSYSSSFVWDDKTFKDPHATMARLRQNGFHINLWQHAFIHPSSPMFDKLVEYSGDYLVWKGLVPDFSLPEAQSIVSEYEKEVLVDTGIDGFKLDECDGSDFTGGWTFPNCATFPSGADGEQYHNMFGTLYAKTILSALGNSRTYSEIRNIGALAASYPYVLYSDLYDHKDFITGVVNSGFSGLLWSPEVRHAENRDDLIRRIQTTVFSAQALVNCFYLEEMPWIKEGCTDEVRELFRVRMSLIPYLFNAFYEYYTVGKAPVRALVCDYADEQPAINCADQYLFGDSMIVAPIISGETSRKVWLPWGEWFDFFTGEKYEGGYHDISVPHIPVFVKGGSLVPIAEPISHVDRDTCFNITLRAYGEVADDTVCKLVYDSDDTYDAQYTVFEVNKTNRGSICPRYNIVGVEEIK